MENIPESSFEEIQYAHKLLTSGYIEDKRLSEFVQAVQIEANPGDIIEVENISGLNEDRLFDRDDIAIVKYRITDRNGNIIRENCHVPFQRILNRQEYCRFGSAESRLKQKYSTTSLYERFQDLDQQGFYPPIRPFNWDNIFRSFALIEGFITKNKTLRCDDDLLKEYLALSYEAGYAAAILEAKQYEGPAKDGLDRPKQRIKGGEKAGGIRSGKSKVLRDNVRALAQTIIDGHIRTNTRITYAWLSERIEERWAEVYPDVLPLKQGTIERKILPQLFKSGQLTKNPHRS